MFSLTKVAAMGLLALGLISSLPTSKAYAECCAFAGGGGGGDPATPGGGGPPPPPGNGWLVGFEKYLNDLADVTAQAAAFIANPSADQEVEVEVIVNYQFYLGGMFGLPDPQPAPADSVLPGGMLAASGQHGAYFVSVYVKWTVKPKDANSPPAGTWRQDNQGGYQGGGLLPDGQQGWKFTYSGQ